MSNSIWHTADQKPEPDARRWIYEKPSPIFPYGVTYRHTITAGCLVKAEWAYIDDLIAQAGKAEQLQMKVDVLEPINDSWTKYCEQKIKQIQRLQKAVDLALGWLEKVATPAKCDDDLCREFTKRKIEEIKQLIKGK